MATIYLLDIHVPRELKETYESPSASHSFEVVGELRYVELHDNPTLIKESLSRAGLPELTPRCTPMIPYEHFARNSLGVEESEVKMIGNSPPFSPDKEAYWVAFKVGYKGVAMSDLMRIWHDEAVVALGLLHGGQVPMLIYKSVLAREVNLFIQMDGKDIDALMLNLPIMKGMGDNVEVIVKAVKKIK